MAGAVREQLIAANEQVETRHGFVHALHDARAEAICLYEIDGWSEVRAADLDRPGASFRPLFDLREQPAARGVVEECGGFSIADEVDRRNRNIGQIKWDDLHTHRADNSKRFLIVGPRGQFDFSEVWIAGGISDAAFKRRPEVSYAQPGHVGRRVPVERHIDDGIVLAIESMNGIEDQSAVLG